MPIILFGKYPWNRHPADDSPEQAVVATRMMKEGISWAENEEGLKLDEDRVRRVVDWMEVVAFVKEMERAGDAIASKCET